MPQRIFQAGASPHLQDKNLKTPLMFAAEHNHSDVVKYLLKATAIIDAKVGTLCLSTFQNMTENIDTHG